MKKSLRLSAAVAVAAAASLTLASCGFGGGSGSDDEAGGTTLDLLVPSYSDNTQGLWEDVIEGFEAENPDISVNLEVQSWDNLESVIATKVQGGEAPDIYNGGPFAGFAADGLLYPAEEVVSADTYGDFQESFLANAEVDGTAYALPLIASARALFVNNALLEQAGVAAAPTTWDELLDAATKISALGGGTAGYGMPLGSEEAQAEAAVWLWGGGGTFGDATEITVDDPANLPGADQIKKMIDAGATQADPGSTDRSPLMDIFIQGKIGMQVGLPPTVGQIEENNPELDYSIVPIPTQDGSPFTLGVMDQLMAFQNDGDKQDAITTFLDYYYTSDVYVPWVAGRGLPARHEVGCRGARRRGGARAVPRGAARRAVLPEHQPAVGGDGCRVQGALRPAPDEAGAGGPDRDPGAGRRGLIPATAATTPMHHRRDR